MAHSLPKILGGTFEQVLAQPALVGYRDFGRYSCVGRITDAGEGSKVNVTLFICRDAETKRRTFIYLHVPLTRRNWKNARDIYLVVPVENLQIKPDVLCAGDIAQLRPDYLKKDGLTSTDKVLRVAMELECPAYAVMPSLPTGVEAPFEGLQGQLLLHWRNLSNLMNMDVFLSDTSAIDQFLMISTRARDGQLTTPELDLTHMYQGCRGVMNNWEQYPCNESVGYPPTWNPCLDHPPPAYHDVAPRQPRQIHHAPIDAKCSPEITWRDTSQPDDQARMAKDANPLSRPRKRKAMEDLAEDPDRSVIARNAFQGIVPCTPTQADSSQDSASSLVNDISVAQPEWASQIAEVEAAITSSLLRRGSTSKNNNSNNNDNDNSPPTLNYVLLNEPCLPLELQEWILKMWDFDPRAHDAHRDALLSLGGLARCRMPAAFDAAMAQLRFDFLQRSSNMLTVPGYRPDDLAGDAKVFQEWLEKQICRNAVALLAAPLRELHFAMARGSVEAFFEQKAKCCALAFIAFGGRV